MNGERCWLTGETSDAAFATNRFLADFIGLERAEAIHLVLKQLRARVEPDEILACELAWQVHAGAYWSQLKRDDGSRFETEETYFREVLGLASWRTAYKRLAIGRMLMTFDESERATIRAAIAEIGVAKASVIAPAIERTRDWVASVQLARQLSTPMLQARVSAALDALPRGYPGEPGERFRRIVLSAMPDLEAMEVVDRFFEVGSHIVGTTNPIGVFLAGCRECLADWEVHRLLRPTSTNRRETTDERDHEI